MAQAGPGEPLVVLDENGLPTGDTTSEERAHAAGDWHGAVVVWVLRSDGGVLLARTPPSDAHEPLRLGPTARAHAGLGAPADDAGAAAERRLGIEARTDRLTHVGSFRSERCYQGSEGRYVDREHQEVYALTDDRPLDELTLDPRSVDTVYEVPLERAVALFETGSYVPAPGFDAMQRVSNALLVEDDLPEEGREALLEQLRALAALSRSQGAWPQAP